MIDLSDKLKNFPPVYYVSFVDSIDRRKILSEQFDKYNIKNVNAIISTKESDKNNIVSGPLLHNLNSGDIGCITSHLKAIKYWYETSNTEYALFLEDDVTLETLEYWNFAWNQFMSKLPHKWECIQLVCIRNELSEIKLRKRIWDDWAVTAYIVNRAYAKRLLDAYYPYEEFILELKNTDYWPIAENVIYFIGRTYTIPLFAENPKIKSTFQGRKNEQYNESLHESSAKFVIDWWKNNGEHTNLDDLIKPEYYQNDLEFNR